MIVPGFAPKRIYLERVAEHTRPSPSLGGNSSSSESRKGFLGVKWSFDGNAKK